MANKKTGLKHEELTEKIIGCAMRVHSYLGCGFQEVIYQRCLGQEFKETGLSFLREHEMPILYHDKKIGTRRVDFFIEDIVLVEIKAISELNEVEHTQMLNYLRVFKIEIGLLFNFGKNKLEFKRFILS
jgi:GxxExxY protein